MGVMGHIYVIIEGLGLGEGERSAGLNGLFKEKRPLLYWMVN